jgi:hypothetical protein
MEIILDIVSDTSNGHEKSQPKIPFILGKKKMKKFDMFYRFANVLTSQIHTFVIFCSSEYKIFKIDILHVYGIHH